MAWKTGSLKAWVQLLWSTLGKEKICSSFVQCGRQRGVWAGSKFYMSNKLLSVPKLLVQGTITFDTEWPLEGGRRM